MEDLGIKVSVYCLTYNHEKYIRSALDGFVSQKTDFNYEVIIHDDASDDKTAEIIREYQYKYPQIIKPIFQKENQYSKGVRICDTFIFPEIKGKYVAICEGDDYWCDENKLQKQVDFLESHMDYSGCTHNTLFINEKTNESFMQNEYQEDFDWEIADIFQWKDKKFHTSSLMFRKEYLMRPKEFYMNKVGDYPCAIYLMLNGKIRMFKEVSSVYRMYTEGSWSSTYQNGSIDKMVELNNNIVNMLSAIDQYSKGQYHEIIQQVQLRKKYEIAMGTKQFLVLQKEYKELLKQESKIVRLYVFMNGYFPGIMKLYYKAKSIFQ